MRQVWRGDGKDFLTFLDLNKHGGWDYIGRCIQLLCRQSDGKTVKPVAGGLFVLS